MGAVAAYVVVLLGTWGILIDAVAAAVVVLAIYLRSRRNAVNAGNAMSEVADSGAAVKVPRNPPPTRRQRRRLEHAEQASTEVPRERAGTKGERS